MRLNCTDLGIFEQAYRIHTESFVGEELAPRGVFEHEWDHGEIFFQQDDKVTGFAIVTFRPIQPYLWEIAVDPTARGAGIGRGLLQEIEDWARHQRYCDITLTCRENNPAQQLYARAGYKNVGVLKKYYGSLGNGLRMRRIL